MSKPITSLSATVNVVAEGDLSNVVGGCGHHGRGYRRSWRRSWHWRKSYGSGYEASEPSESSEGFEPSESAELESETPAFAGDAQVANVSVALNIAQRQG